MNEKSFTVSCQIAQNEYEIILKALADSETDDFVFINTLCAIEVTKFFNTTVIYLNISCSVHEYDEKSDVIIIYMIIFYLVMNDHCQLNVLILILNLEHHNLILRKK